MNKLLEQAFDAVRRLPAANQDEIARVILALVSGDKGASLDVLESLAQARRRQFAADAEVEAAFRRFDP